MWSDDEIDSAFRRLDPPEPEPESFPLDAWLRLESRLDRELMERQFRLRLWKFFAGEIAVLGLVGLAWLLWPTPEAATTLPAQQAVTTLSAPQNITAGRQQVAAAAGSTNAAVPGTAAGKLITREAALDATAPASSEPATVETLPTHASLAGASSTHAATHSPINRAVVLGTTKTTRHPALAGTDEGNDKVATKPSHSTVRAESIALSAGQGTTATLVPAPQDTQAKTRRKMKGYVAAISQPAKSRNRTMQEARQPDRSGDLAVTASRRSPAVQQKLSSTGAAQPNSTDAGTTALTAQYSQSGDQASQQLATMPAADQPSADLAGLALLPVALNQQPATPLPSSLATVPVTPTEVQPLLRRPRLYLGLVGAPDVSTVRMADYQSPRPNYGVVVEYRVLDRLRLTTGVLRGTKVYRARRDDYDWSGYAIPSYADFEWVEGSCTILDVPLNLRYDVLARPRSLVFGSAGLSSLFMQRESYAYDYSYYRTQYHWQKDYVNENQHWFSVLNLSLGYERRLGQHWGLQAEPYVKLPLGGVGAGKVRLASGGVFFGVKYGF